MKRTVIATAVVLVSLTSSAHATSAYEDGYADWQRFKTWQISLPENGPYSDGAHYWIVNRNRAGHLDCATASSAYASGSSLYGTGCNVASSLLGPMDLRRSAEPAYKSGFNDAARVYRPGDSLPTQPVIENVTIHPVSQPPQVVENVVVHDDPPREPESACKSAVPTMSKILRREINSSDLDVDFDYQGGRYVGRMVYKCLFRAMVKTTDDALAGNGVVTVQKDTNWKVELMGESRIYVTDMQDKNW